MSSDLPIVSIQELVKEPLSEVPEIYVCREQDPPPTIIHSPDGKSPDPATLPTIPIISMENLLSDDKTLSADELEKLDLTCKDWGIFQLVNHGVSSSQLEKLRLEIEEFFKLPLKEKLKYGIRAGDVEGYGNFMRTGNKLDWGDRFFMIINPLARRKPHLLPEFPSSLRDNIENYIKEMESIAIQLLLLMAKCLEIDMKEIRDQFEEDGLQTLRMNYYPPCPQPELVVGLTPHSDASTITILNEINGVGGFQIKRDGAWVPISIRENALVVNVGDVMEMLSNGTYNSIEHRATVNSEKERISIAVFFNPKLDTEIGPSPSIVSPNNPALFRRLTMENYVKGCFSQKLNGKSYLEKMRIGMKETEE